jgi:peptidoglycan/LPS O-acetylase OafA/YrhL
MQQKDRSLGLDLLRAVAILWVLVCHGLFIIYDLLYEPIGNLLTRYGHYGVGLFFVLSGFLIGRIFIEDFTSKNVYTYKDIGTFWKRRWFRTIPNYFFFLLIYVVLHFLVSSGLLKTEVWTPNFNLESFSLLPRYFFFGQNLVTENPTFFGQSWSLSVEEWFYLLLPLLFIGFFHSNKDSYRSLPLKLTGLLLGITFFKFLVFFFTPSFYNEIKVIFCLDFILYGVVVAACCHLNAKRLEQFKNILLVVGLLLFVFTNCLYIGTVLKGYHAEMFQLVINCLTSLSFAFILPYFINYKTRKSLFSIIIEKVSISSYTMYLSHFIFLEFFMQGFILQFFPDSQSYFRIFAFFLFLIACTLFSYLHFINFEKPLMKLRDRKIRHSFEVSLIKMSSGLVSRRKKIN